MAHIETLFDAVVDPTKDIRYPEYVDLYGILNTHTHPRDGIGDVDGRAELFVPYLARVYEDALGIGNTEVPLTTALLTNSTQ